MVNRLAQSDKPYLGATPPASRGGEGAAGDYDYDYDYDYEGRRRRRKNLRWAQMRWRQGIRLYSTTGFGILSALLFFLLWQN